MVHKRANYTMRSRNAQYIRYLTFFLSSVWPIQYGLIESLIKTSRIYQINILKYGLFAFFNRYGP